MPLLQARALNMPGNLLKFIWNFDAGPLAGAACAWGTIMADRDFDRLLGGYHNKPQLQQRLDKLIHAAEAAAAKNPRLGGNSDALLEKVREQEMPKVWIQTREIVRATIKEEDRAEELMCRLMKSCLDRVNG
jgi:hypothetical protein